MVFARLFKRRIDPAAVEAVYSGVVAASRAPTFYTRFAVADTIDGRFDLLALHLHLVLRRLQGEGGEATGFAQALFDRFTLDLDHSLRASGVGDMSVGKRVKQMIAAFYGRAGAYEEALAAADDAALSQALARNVYAAEAPTAASDALAGHVRAESGRLSVVPAADLLAGRDVFAGSSP